ncbi:uncharacterized protein LOC120392710 isoform X2 [Mauremys reevesii]|uniref:uncharacterized protein LOC120392710 isoform X2 n=1 Tax=Mauremys reevesii TaxID=260615 RepID=UPI0019400782|nr:uncharacterized protein LOC120392710 isoform X2 [Mauremys reevesii]
MRLWLLAGLAAALTLVAVAGADLGDLTEVEDVVGEKEDRLRVRREDKKPRPPPSQPCPGCYSLLSKPGKPARARRQVEKQQQPKRRPTWRPGSLSLLRPAKPEVQDSEVRTRREVERDPQLRPGPRSNSPGHSLYNYGYMTVLSSPANISLQGPAPHGRGRRAAEGTEPRTLKPKRPRLPCSGCYSPLVSPKSPPEEVKDKLPAPKLPCPGCHGSVATGQEGRSAEGILSPRTRREDERPTVAKRQAKQRARDRLYCAGCYSGLTLRSQTPPLREAADGGSSGD